MTENSVDDLHYGHCGEISYDQQTRLWASKRPLAQSSAQLIPVGVPVQYATASFHELPDPQNEKLEYSAKVKKLRKVVKSHPEVAPASSTLYDLLPLRVATSTAFHDDVHSMGDLIAVGKARAVDLGSGGSRHIMHSLLAIAGGESGNCVRLFEMRAARQGWEFDRSIWLSTFELKEAQAALWESDGGHVRQICFARRREEDTTLLAVRTATSITIMRPLYQNMPVIGSLASKGAGYSASRVLPNALITLKMPPLGDAECVDVVFNPWYQQQVAAVNSAGCFVLWTIQGRRLVEAENIGGRMTEQFLVDDEDLHPFRRHDGWHKISWIGNSSTMVVCNRTRLEAFEIRGQMMSSSGTDILAAHSPLWVLDMRKHPTSDNDLFITTTTHILWLRFQRDTTFDKITGFRGSFETVLSWRHDRDVKDGSLQLSFRLLTNGFSAVLFSKQRSLITEFRCMDTANDGPIAMSSFAPCSVEQISSKVGSHDDGYQKEPISGLVFLPLDYGERSFESSQHTLGNRYRSLGCTFDQVLQLNENLSLTGQMFHSLNQSGDSHQKSRALNVVAPSWTKLRKRYAPRKKDKALDDFVVDEEEASQSGVDEPGIRRKVHTRNRISRNANVSYDEDQVAWSVPNEPAYNHVRIRETNRENVDNPITIIAETLSESSSIHPSLQPLHAALSTIQSALTEINDSPASTEQSLIENVAKTNSETRLRLARLASLTKLGLRSSNTAQNSISAVTNTCRAAYLENLAEGTTNDVHSSREELIAKAARHLFFATIGVQILPVDIEPVEPGYSAATEHTSQQSSLGTAPFSSQIVSSQSRTLQSSQLALSQARSSRIPMRSAVPALHPIQRAIARLSARAPIVNTSSAHISATTGLQSHWSAGIDPATYDWEATSASVSGVVGGFIAGSDMSTVDRQRQLRRAERQAEREKEKETRLAKRRRLDLTGMFSDSPSQPWSQINERWRSSQPQTTEIPQRAFESQPQSYRRYEMTSPQAPESQNMIRAGMRSSPGFRDIQTRAQSGHYPSQTHAPMVVASQMEPGRYGGRPDISASKVANNETAGRLQMPLRDRRGGRGARKAGF